MDIELARTFLAIVRNGSFIAAAEQLHVTQTTVSARVRGLESLLGCRLFVRSRQGAILTDDGQHFVHYATQLVQTWDASRRSLPLPQGAHERLSIGCEVSLWNPLLVDWLSQLRNVYPALAIRAEVGEPERLHSKLKQSLLDVILVHQPDYHPHLQVEQILEEKLILVQSTTQSDPYIFVDWGGDFRKQHDFALPQYARSNMELDLGPLALQILLQGGGKGYFRTRVVQPYLDSGALAAVPNSPEFTYPVFILHGREVNALLIHAISTLRSTLNKRKCWMV